MLPGSGDVLYITRAASVQFVEPFFFRVIRVHEWSTYEGWVWLDGYQLDRRGDAVDRRSIFVMIDGLRKAPVTPAPARTAARPRNHAPRSANASPTRRTGQPARHPG